MTFESDQQRAHRERVAREHLMQVGAAALPRPPWLHHSQPLSSTDLVRFALWRGQSELDTPADVSAALALLPSARAEVEQMETALLFAARAHDLAWGRIARAMGLMSAQAAHQRFGRLSTRTSTRSDI